MCAACIAGAASPPGFDARPLTVHLFSSLSSLSLISLSPLSQADTPADAHPPPALGEEGEHPPPPGPQGHHHPVPAAGAVAGGLGYPLADLAPPPPNQPGGPLVGGAAAAFAATPSAADAALKGHDDEVKALHGAGGGHSHEPTHSKGGSKKGVGPGGISGANRIMDSRRAHYGVPQGRRTGGD